MILGNSDLHFEIPELERKLTAAQELLVLPSVVIIVNSHSRIELRNGIKIVVILGEVLVTAAAAILHPVIDGVVPGDIERHFVARLQCRREINAHHGLIDHVRQCLAGCIRNFGDLEASLIVTYT